MSSHAYPAHLVFILLAASACSGSDGPRDVGAARPDASHADAAAQDAATADSGLQDAGQIDAGDPDSGEPLAAQVVLQLREMDLHIFGTDALGSVLIARAAETYPETGCVQYSTTAPALPSIGMLSASGIDVAELSCFNNGPSSGHGVRCLSNGAAPPPIAGSTLDTGPWLNGTDPTLGVAGGADLGALTGTLAPPTASADILEPSTLPTTNSGDLTVRWTPLGHQDLVIELESTTAGQAALTVCAPDSDGQVTIPTAMIGDALLRLSVGNYSEVVVADAEQRPLRLQVMRGTILAP